MWKDEEGIYVWRENVVKAVKLKKVRKLSQRESLYQLKTYKCQLTQWRHQSIHVKWKAKKMKERNERRRRKLAVRSATKVQKASKAAGWPLAACAVKLQRGSKAEERNQHPQRLHRSGRRRRRKRRKWRAKKIAAAKKACFLMARYRRECGWRRIMKKKRRRLSASLSAAAKKKANRESLHRWSEIKSFGSYSSMKYIVLVA